MANPFFTQVRYVNLEKFGQSVFYLRHEGQHGEGWSIHSGYKGKCGEGWTIRPLIRVLRQTWRSFVNPSFTQGIKVNWEENSQSVIYSGYACKLVEGWSIRPLVRVCM